ncbi:MAG: hypothetical protein GXO57_06870 [Thermodesulfobacteria bacterium]|nr:hypothetical protein [Thermodesulfobacteriota bacterium]
MIKNLKLIKVIDPDPTSLILEKIKVAEELFDAWNDYFYKDEEFMNMLKNYEKAVIKSNETMEKFGTFKECYVCSVLEKKGCCKAGLENEVTVNILLINMFLGKEIPKEREVPLRCFFVGPTGCKIFARPFLCRDYFCKRLLNMLGDEKYAIITQVLQEELSLLYKLTNYIKKELEFLLGEFLIELDLTGVA